MVPLAAVSHHSAGTTRLSVNHHGLFASTTLSFNLQPGMSLSDATRAVTQAMEEIHMPTSIHGIFAGTAGTFQQSLSSEPLLIAAALLAVYIVLGVLYESYIHPITIISTLPSAGVGAVLALMVWHTEFSIIALIGVILLIGIVKKNAIMMIDFAIHAERTLGLTPREAIYQACLLRFRPIMMTTLAALLGAVPLALSYGDGARAAQAAGHFHRRGTDRQPDADALYDPGRLRVSRPLSELDQAPMAAALVRCRSGGGSRMICRASASRRIAPDRSCRRLRGASPARLRSSACAVGPNYHRPSAPVPSAYKELPPGWKVSTPKDERGPRGLVGDIRGSRARSRSSAR